MTRPAFIYNLVTRLWPLSGLAYQLAKRPLIGALVRPFFNPRTNQAVILPVNESIPTPQHSVLPYSLLETLVHQSSSRFIMKECLCRTGQNCQTYPHELGCIYLGDGAATINPKLGQAASEDEALAHIQTAIGKKLIPLIVHTSFDALLLGIPYKRMLTVCFCCDCCCTVRQGLRIGPSSFWDVVFKLPGLTVDVNEDCIGCEVCLDVCAVQAIEFQAGRARIDGQCKGCGRCLDSCPTGAIQMHYSQQEIIYQRLMDRIQSRTSIN